MRRVYYSFTLLFIALIFSSSNLMAQGCVAVRQIGGLTPMSTGGYTLMKGEFQVGGNYRYFHSWRYFIGKEEQPDRQKHGGGFDANGKELGNAVNIYSHSFDITLSYGITDRLQLNVAIPYVHNERSQVLTTTSGDKRRYSIYVQGLGDMRVNAGYWVFDPHTATKGNLMIGLGIKQIQATIMQWTMYHSPMEALKVLWWTRQYNQAMVGLVFRLSCRDSLNCTKVCMAS